MPNLQNAIKQLRKDTKRAERNLAVKADIRTAVKKIKKAIDSKDSQVETLLADIQQKLDKAVKNNILKRNTASRKLARLYAYKKKTTTK